MFTMHVLIYLTHLMEAKKYGIKNLIATRLRLDFLLHTVWFPFQLCQLPFGSLGTKCHLDVDPVASHKIYYKGEGGGFPQV
jgi:hypothetical protein